MVVHCFVPEASVMLDKIWQLQLISLPGRDKEVSTREAISHLLYIYCTRWIHQYDLELRPYRPNLPGELILSHTPIDTPQLLLARAVPTSGAYCHLDGHQV